MMMVSAHVALAALLMAGSGSLVVPDSVGFDPSSPVSAAVRDSVANRWSVDAASVVLQWGPIRDEWRENVPSAVSLLGAGAGGYWVISYPTPEGGDVRVRVRAGVNVEQAVAATSLARDAVLTAEDIRIETQVSWGSPQAKVHGAEPGWVTHRSIREGQALRSPAVTPPLAVRSGDQVQAVWRKGGIEMVLQARAAGSASIGDNVYVRSSDGVRYKGVVTAPGHVLLETGAPRER